MKGFDLLLILHLKFDLQKVNLKFVMIPLMYDMQPFPHEYSLVKKYIFHKYHQFETQFQLIHYQDYLLHLQNSKEMNIQEKFVMHKIIVIRLGSYRNILNLEEKLLPKTIPSPSSKHCIMISRLFLFSSCPCKT